VVEELDLLKRSEIVEDLLRKEISINELARKIEK